MRFHLVLIYFMLSLPANFSSSAAAAAPLSKFPIALPGCADHCGNISIPYPFGLTQECVYPVLICNSYKLTCNYSFNPPKLLWDQPGYREVTDISLDGQITVNELVARDCYNEKGARTSYLEPKLYLPLHFYVNITANRFTVVGCDASGVGWFGARTNSIGCSTACDSEEDLDLVGETCGGLGCCQTEIPQDVTGALLELKSTTNYTQVSGIHNCSYGFVAEKGAFNLSRNNVIGLKNTSVLPLIADWDIGGTCEEVRTKASVYACKSANSACFDHPHRLGVYRGYRCRCEEGYEGNPYLVDGCRDINECEGTEHHCEFVCINTPGGFNCSCPKGFDGDGRENGAGCVRLPPSKMVNVSIGLGAGIGFLLLLSMCIWSQKTYKKLKKNKRKQKIFKRNGGLQLQQQAHEGAIPKIKHFSEEELDKATDHFNKCRILGQGAQGTVYKGMLTDGRIVAIKKSKQVDENHLGQFINEVVILSQINHRNVVKLLGCCLETEVPLLVYEFVPNGTLFELLHDQTNDFQISWSMRLRIASDIAGAVAYMHSASTVPVFHRDIKSSNILLDEKYVVKVSDFGTSKSVVLDQTHLTTLVKGTFGYLDPEYFQSSQFTDKSDVYSFGVVLVELLTGQRPISLLSTEEEKGLANRFLNHMESDRYQDMLDAQVLEEGSKEEVMAVARLARRCLNVKGKMRPTMKEVAIELESIRMSHKPASAEAEFRKTYSYQASETVLSDAECAWSSSVNSGTSTSYDHHPLMPETR